MPGKRWEVSQGLCGLDTCLGKLYSADSEQGGTRGLGGEVMPRAEVSTGLVHKAAGHTIREANGDHSSGYFQETLAGQGSKGWN